MSRHSSCPSAGGEGHMASPTTSMEGKKKAKLKELEHFLVNKS